MVVRAHRCFVCEQDRGTLLERHNPALICLARHRVDVIFVMLRDRQPYQHPTTHGPTQTASAA